MPPLWQSLKRGALSKLLYRKFNLNTVNNDSKGATYILHYQHFEKLSSHILENMQSFTHFCLFIVSFQKRYLELFFFTFLVSQIEVGFEFHMLRENIQLTCMYSSFSYFFQYAIFGSFVC